MQIEAAIDDESRVVVKRYGSPVLVLSHRVHDCEMRIENTIFETVFW